LSSIFELIIVDCKKEVISQATSFTWNKQRDYKELQNEEFHNLYSLQNTAMRPYISVSTLVSTPSKMGCTLWQGYSPPCHHILPGSWVPQSHI
jgi:hypothetical protein